MTSLAKHVHKLYGGFVDCVLEYLEVFVISNRDVPPDEISAMMHKKEREKRKNNKKLANNCN